MHTGGVNYQLLLVFFTSASFLLYKYCNILLWKMYNYDMNVSTAGWFLHECMSVWTSAATNAIVEGRNIPFEWPPSSRSNPLGPTEGCSAKCAALRTCFRQNFRRNIWRIFYWSATHFAIVACCGSANRPFYWRQSWCRSRDRSGDGPTFCGPPSLSGLSVPSGPPRCCPLASWLPFSAVSVNNRPPTRWRRLRRRRPARWWERWRKLTHPGFRFLKVKTNIRYNPLSPGEDPGHV